MLEQLSMPEINANKKSVVTKWNFHNVGISYDF